MVNGIDVSKWQGRIDWSKASGAAKFAFIKASQNNFADERFRENWPGARGKLLRGAYHFYDYRYAGKPQAEFLWSLIRADPGELPPVLDLEFLWTPYPNRETMLALVQEFLTRLDALAGRKAILYTNPAMLAYLAPLPDWLTDRPLFIAHYYVTAPDLRNWPGSWTFWQHGLGKGQGPNYGTESLDIDLDYFNGTLDELRAFTGQTGQEDTPMGKWDYCARGVLLDSRHVNVPLEALAGCDFVINDVGSWGQDFDTTAAQRLSIASGLQVPSIVKMWIDYLPYVGRGFDNVANWPKGDQEEHLRWLDRALYFYWLYGGQMRYYHAILWDMTHYLQPDGKTMYTSGWIVKPTDYLITQGWNRYKLPAYPLFSQAVINKYADQTNFSTAFLQNANFNPMSCIDHAWAVGDMVVEKFSDIPRAPDAWQPDYLWSPSWGFAEVAKAKFKIKGVTDATGNLVYVPVYYFNGSPARLRELLLPKGTPVTPPVEPPDEEEEPLPVGDTDLEIINLLKAILVEVKRERKIT